MDNFDKMEIKDMFMEQKRSIMNIIAVAVVFILIAICTASTIRNILFGKLSDKIDAIDKCYTGETVTCETLRSTCRCGSNGCEVIEDWPHNKEK